MLIDIKQSATSAILLNALIIIIIIIIHEYYYGGAVALLLQDHLTMSVTEQSHYLSAAVQREHKTCPGVNPQGNTP